MILMAPISCRISSAAIVSARIRDSAKDTSFLIFLEYLKKTKQLEKIVRRHKMIGYNVNVMQQTLCIVVNPNMADNFASLFNCTTVCWASMPFLIHHENTPI